MQKIERCERLKVNEAQKQISDVDRIGRAVADSFESGMVSAFEGVITGTKSMKDAFKIRQQVF